ncbi:MAG TPA: argininosuccinate lyase [bacterium]|nr:argininosuccinate lyase [bacterium]
MKKYKAWSGRFKKETSSLMEKFNSSIAFDQRLYKEDITGSIAYAKALKKAGIISARERDLIIKGLDGIKKEFDKGKFEIFSYDEDIHMAVERRLVEKIGAAGKKLHTGRSRNDQVVTDTRLFLKNAARDLISDLVILQKSIVKISQRTIDVVIPGYTHLQQAQPVLLAHYFMSFFWSFQRDRERLKQCMKRIDVLPLGSGAIAGVSFNIDREYLAKQLGFSSVSENSIDTISDRDFIIEFVSACSILMMHLSRYAEDLIIWSSEEFGYIEVDDAYSTGSSMLPQKKNPDSLELIRGKTGRIYGNLISLLTLLKGVPLAYCKDLQEDKEPLFDSVDNVSISIKIFRGVLDTLKIDRKRIRKLSGEYLLAVDLSDYLVKKGMPFRESHEVVGGLIKYAVDNNISLLKIPLEKYKKSSKLFEKDIYKVIDLKKSVESKKTTGSTSPSSVKKQILSAERKLKK